MPARDRVRRSIATGVYVRAYRFPPILARRTGLRLTQHSDDQVTGKLNNRESIFSWPLNERAIESTVNAAETETEKKKKRKKILPA